MSARAWAAAARRGVGVVQGGGAAAGRKRWSGGIRTASSQTPLKGGVEQDAGSVHGRDPASSAAAAAAAEPRELYKDQEDTWADRRLPAAVLPYAKLMRVDRPIGTFLVLQPGWWSIALAAETGQLPDLKLLALFGVGAFVMRGAGCTINDIWDRDIDAKVARTKMRPLADGKVSLTQAVAFLAAQSTVGLGVLLQLNPYTIALGAASVVPVAMYPLAKRYVSWPQAVLGLTINWGALVGWSAVHGDLDLSVVVPLYIGSACWTLAYDTIYAYQDKVDDRKLGLNSSALTIGDQNAKPVLSAFAVGAVGLWTVAGYNAGLGMSPCFNLALAGSAAHLSWQIITADLDNRINLTNRFVSNSTLGWLMMAGIVGGKLGL